MCRRVWPIQCDILLLPPIIYYQHFRTWAKIFHHSQWFYRIPVWDVNVANIVAIAVIKFRNRSSVFLYVKVIMTFCIQYAVLDNRKLFATWPKIQLALKCCWGPLAAERSLRTPERNDTEERERERKRGRERERERKRHQFVLKNVNGSECRMPLTTNYSRIWSEAEL